jgi:hypothetical protein
MALKPTKMTFRYESWRGSSTDLVEIAHVIKGEIDRAVEISIARGNEELEAFLAKSRTEFEQTLRAKASLKPPDPLPANLQAELTQAIARAEDYRRQRRTENEQSVRANISLIFGYTDRSGHLISSQSPDFLQNLTSADSISLRGYAFAKPTASIAVTLQNRPWEVVALEIEGQDTDWVSSATAPLHRLLSSHESKIVKFFRNAWVKGVVGVSVWALFVPPLASLFRGFNLGQLIAVPVALLPTGVVNAVYQRLTPPVLIASSAPSTWRELVRVAVSAVVAGLIKYGLDGLARLVLR